MVSRAERRKGRLHSRIEKERVEVGWGSQIPVHAEYCVSAVQ